MATAKLSKKELYKPPSYGELKALEFAEKQLNTHLLSLQIDELLREIFITNEVRRTVDNFVAKVGSFLTSLLPSGNDNSLQEMMSYIESDDEIKIPFPRELISSISVKGSFRFIPPKKVFTVGSWKTDSIIDKVVDVAILMPKDCMQEKDYLNYRCFIKRAIFIRHIVSQLLEAINKKEQSVENIGEVYYSCVDGNVLWPTIIIKPADNSIKSFTFRLIPFFDRAALKPSRFSNDISNIRLDDCLAISLVYNQSVLADLTMDDTQYRVEMAFGIRPQPGDDSGPRAGLINGLKLLKIWSKQRQSLLSQGAGLGGHFWSLVIVHLLSTKRLNTMMTPLQVFKITMQSVADEKFGKGVPLSILAPQFAPKTDEAPADWSSFDVVLTDSSGLHNFAYRMSAWQLQKLKLLATETVITLEAFDRFDATFLASVHSSDFYDQVWSFRLESLENISDSVSPKTIDALIEAKRLILERLERGIGRRVRCIDFIEDSYAYLSSNLSVRKPLPDCLVKPLVGVDLRVGVCFNSETFMDVIDKGPPADTPEATKFRQFWLKKSELRRFQDGSILEAVVWDECPHGNVKEKEPPIPAAERTVLSRRMISFQAACWVLENHCGISTESLFCSEAGTQHLLTPLLRKFPVRSYGSGEELFSSFTAAYERLTKMLKSVERTMALGFQSVQGVGASFRFTEVFPPLPAAFDQSMTEVVNNVRVPNASKLCPPYLIPNDVVIMLEGGGAAWPDEWSAFRRVRAALHVQLFRALGEEWPEMSKQVNTNWVDVVVEGFVFRLKLRCQHEVNILRTKKDATTGKTSTLELGASKQAAQLINEIQTRPKLTAILHGLASTQSFVYSSTCRLFKRWLAAQMFTGHIAEDVIDIMVASIFVTPSTVPCPVSPLSGFLRTLKLVATHDWRLTPLIVNLNGEFSHGRLNELMLDVAKNRQNYPSFSVLSPLDPLSEWTRDAPSVVVMNRLILLAAKAYDRLSSLIAKKNATHSECSIEMMNLFTPDLSVFDAVIELDRKFLSRRHEALNVRHHCSATSDSDNGMYLPKFKDAKTKASNVGPVVVTPSKQFPVVDFDMQEKLINELRSAYGEIALFFYDRYGGSKIGIVWRPTGEREFKLQNMNLSHPTISASAGKKGPAAKGDEVSLTTNRAAAIADFRFIGQGIIVDIVTATSLSNK